MWKNLGGILVNIVGRFQGQKPLGLRPLGFLALELPRDNIHQDPPSAFPHIVSVQRDTSSRRGPGKLLQDVYPRKPLGLLTKTAAQCVMVVTTALLGGIVSWCIV